MASSEATAIIETVTGPVGRGAIARALGHEHLFVDFLGPEDPAYCRVDWDEVRATCLERLADVRGDGVGLLVDCTPIGIGRNVGLLRDVSISSDIRIVCATGIYKALRPPALRDAPVDELAELFVQELTVGIGDYPSRAGFVKLATTETGSTEEETIVHRAGAMAAAATGSAVVLHSPLASTLATVLRTLEGEGFHPTRLVWAHAQEATLTENLELASEGITISLDAIGTSDDEEMLDRVEQLAAADSGDRVILSSDSSLVVHPVDMAYERDILYVHGTFAAKVEARFGRGLREALTLGNIFRAFARVPAS